MILHAPEIEEKLEKLNVPQALGLLFWLIGAGQDSPLFAEMLRRGLNDLDVMQRQQPHKQMDRQQGDYYITQPARAEKKFDRVPESDFDAAEWQRSGGGL